MGDAPVESADDETVVEGARVLATESVVESTTPVSRADMSDVAVGDKVEVNRATVDGPQAPQDGYGHQLKVDVPVTVSCRSRKMGRGAEGTPVGWL